jgi:signal peptidase I
MESPEEPTEPVTAPPVASEEPDASAPPAARKKSSAQRTVIEWALVIGGALAIALFLHAFVVQTFYIPSPSMTPTLQVNDRVIVDKVSYRFHNPHRKDIVVFTTPPTVPKEFKDLVKRVIGLPGDRVEARNGHVFVNRQELNEPYLAQGTDTKDFGPVTVPAGEYWVMGDNRENSQDSRVFGPIPKSTIVGRAFLRIWPLSRFGFL